MRHFSIRPTLTMKGRTFKGLRGWSGKPLHPPLTDIPITSFILAGGLDFASVLGGKDHTWAHEFWHAGTYAFVAGTAGAVLAASSGLWDARASSEAGTQARRTINSHAAIMSTMMVLAIVDLVWRLDAYHSAATTPAAVAVLSVLVALLASIGAMFGGTLVFDYGFNVETASDSAVWHRSETDVLPGHNDAG